MEAFKEYISQIEDQNQRNQVGEVLQWISEEYPQLSHRIAWNQPSFTNHGTFIISLSIYKNHFALCPEPEGIERFSEEIIKSGYEYTKMFIKVKWGSPVNYILLKNIIDFNIDDKKDYKTYWRK